MSWSPILIITWSVGWITFLPPFKSLQYGCLFLWICVITTWAQSHGVLSSQPGRPKKYHCKNFAGKHLKRTTKRYCYEKSWSEQRQMLAIRQLAKLVHQRTKRQTSLIFAVGHDIPDIPQFVAHLHYLLSFLIDTFLKMPSLHKKDHMCIWPRAVPQAWSSVKLQPLQISWYLMVVGMRNPLKMAYGFRCVPDCSSILEYLYGWNFDLSACSTMFFNCFSIVKTD